MSAATNVPLNTFVGSMSEMVSSMVEKRDA